MWALEILYRAELFVFLGENLMSDTYFRQVEFFEKNIEELKAWWSIQFWKFLDNLKCQDTHYSVYIKQPVNPKHCDE